MVEGNLTSIRLGRGRITILPTVKGLTRERKKVRDAVAAVGPDAIALPVSLEGLRGLRAVNRGVEPEIFLSHYEEIYALKLSRYGKVAVPPPSYTEAYAVSTEKKIPVLAIDMSEKEFANAFCEDVSGTNLVYHSIRWRWLKRKSFREAADAGQFVLAWDRAVNSLKGFRNLEGRREEHMARRLLGLSQKYKNILAVLEMERMEGVVRRLGSPTTTPLDEEEGLEEEEENGEGGGQAEGGQKKGGRAAKTEREEKIGERGTEAEGEEE